MLKDDVIKFLNYIFKKSQVPLKINDVFLYRPVYHEPPFEHLEPITEAKRLALCNPVWIEFEVEHLDHRYLYQLRCVREKKKFIQKRCWLRMCDYLPNEDPKKMEKDMEKNANIVSKLLLHILELLTRQ